MAAELSDGAKKDAVYAVTREASLDAWENQPWDDQCSPERDAERIGEIWRKRCSAAFRAGYDAGVKDASSQAGVITGVDHATGTATISSQAAQIAALYERSDIDASQVVKLTERVRELEQRVDPLGELDARAVQVVQLTDRVRELEKVAQKFLDLLSAHKFG